MEDKVFVGMKDGEKVFRDKTPDEKIRDLRGYLNGEWSWKWERHNAELQEISLGLREKTTQTTEELILLRKNAVEEINKLEQ